MELWGFATRAEFFRFCAIEFLKSGAGSMPSEKAGEQSTIRQWAEKRFGDKNAANGEKVATNFARWFGNSIAEKDGQPLEVVHHGFVPDDVFLRVDQQKNVTRPYPSEWGPAGHWFGVQKGKDTGASHKGYGPNKRDAWIKVENPIEYGTMADNPTVLTRDQYVRLSQEFGVAPDPLGFANSAPLAVRPTATEAGRLYDQAVRQYRGYPQWKGTIDFLTRSPTFSADVLQQRYNNDPVAMLDAFVNRVKEVWNVDFSDPRNVAEWT